MKKPAKILVAATLLVFAAAGFYYAWLSPAKKPASSQPPIVVTRRDPVGVKVPSETPGAELRESPSMDRAAMPTPVPTASASTTPEGFKPAAAPAGTLPPRLDGFEKAPAADLSNPSTTRSTTVPPASAPTGAAGSTSPSSLPPLPPPSTTVRPTPTTPAMPAAAPKPLAPAAPAKPVETTYTVKEGDTLTSIWKGLSGSERGWEKLQAANPGLDPARLKIGQVLKVPAMEATKPSPTAPTAAATTGAGEYTVKEGDTLSSIAAEKLGASKRWKEIYDANKATIGSDPAALKVGMKLAIPGQTASKPAAPAKPATTSPAPPPVSVPPSLPSMPASRSTPSAGAGSTGGSTPGATPPSDIKPSSTGSVPPAPRTP